MEEYDGRRRYTGQEWTELLRAMDGKQIKSTLKTAYGRIGKEIADLARASLTSSDIRNASRMKRLIRVRVYPDGGGFMITVRPHGSSGFYTNHAGLQKPVLMWAEEGTRERKPRHKTAYVVRTVEGRFITTHGMGAEKAYHILTPAEQRGGQIIQAELPSDIEAAAVKRMEKTGWT